MDDFLNQRHVLPLNQRKRVGVESSISNMNEDWKYMFGSTNSDKRSTEKAKKVDDPQTLAPPPVPLQRSVDSQYEHIAATPVQPGGGKENLVPARCNVNLTSLINRRAALYKADAMREDAHLCADINSRPAPSSWRPRGVLVAHLHEHRTCVNRIRV